MDSESTTIASVIHQRLKHGELRKLLEERQKCKNGASEYNPNKK